jgi:DNA-binding transcriptional ArsR family regulator
MSSDLRVRFLQMLSSRPSLTPAQGLKLLDEREVNVSTVAYHALILFDGELVERQEVGTEFAYRLTAKGTCTLAAFGFSPRMGSAD